MRRSVAGETRARAAEWRKMIDSHGLKREALKLGRDCYQVAGVVSFHTMGFMRILMGISECCAGGHTASTAGFGDMVSRNGEEFPRTGYEASGALISPVESTDCFSTGRFAGG